VETSRVDAGRRLAAGVWMLSLALACSSSPAARPDILLITLDTFRYDRPGYAGYEPHLTPAIDALAAESAIFEQAVTSMATTFPAHATILTGAYPTRHGVRHNGVYSLPDEAITLTERLRDAGYATGAVVGSVVLAQRFGLGQGFDHVPGRELARCADRQALSRVLVDDDQHPKGATVGRAVLDEVVGPDMIRALGPPADARAVVKPQPASLRLAFRNFQPLLAPQALDPLRTRGEALLA